MKIMTINVPEDYVELLDTLKRLGKYPSRSEACRVAIRDFLFKELDNIERIFGINKKAERYLKDLNGGDKQVAIPTEFPRIKTHKILRRLVQ